MIWKAAGRGNTRIMKRDKTPPRRDVHAGGAVLYLPEICSAVLLFEVCLFSILENVSV